MLSWMLLASALVAAPAASDDAWCKTAVGSELVAHAAAHLDDAQIGEISQTLCREAASSELDPLLVLALMHQESTYDPQAQSAQRAKGLMQLLSATAKGVAQRHGLPSHDCLDPQANVTLGVRYLAELVLEFGSLEPALLAYNIGPPALHTRLKRGPVDVHGAKFVVRVMHYYRGLQRQYPRPDGDA